MEVIEETPIVDYSHQNYWNNALVVQGKGTNVLALYGMDRPYRRGDGKIAEYELVNRWLSRPCENDDDDNYVCVLGSEVTYWTKAELKSLLKKLERKDAINLFDQFKLY